MAHQGVSELTSFFGHLARVDSVEELISIFSASACSVLGTASAQVAVLDSMGYRLLGHVSGPLDGSPAHFVPRKKDSGDCSLLTAKDRISVCDEAGTTAASILDIGTLMIVPDGKTPLAWEEWQISLLEQLGRMAYAILQRIEHLESTKVALAKSRLAHDEMSHRLKNAYASAIGLARISMPRDEASEYASRVQALVTSYDAIDMIKANSRSSFAFLGELLVNMLSPYQRSDDVPVSISGPQLKICTTQTSGIGLIVNELATNSLKHGALSSHKGTVDVRWTASDATVALTWREQFDRPLMKPPGTGRGCSLIQNISKQYLFGEADWYVNANGAICEITFPLAQDISWGTR